VHFRLHDAFEIGDGDIELALASLDADDRMRRAAELDACPWPAPRRLVEAVIGDEILGDQVLDHAHHSRHADVQPLGEARWRNHAFCADQIHCGRPVQAAQKARFR